MRHGPAAQELLGTLVLLAIALACLFGSMAAFGEPEAPTSPDWGEGEEVLDP